jgi:hypothetical protein
MSDDKQRETPELEGWYHIVAGWFPVSEPLDVPALQSELSK